MVRELTVFHPLPEVGRAVFLATPHRGAEVSEGWALRLVRRAIRLPFTVLRDTCRIVPAQQDRRAGTPADRFPQGPAADRSGRSQSGLAVHA